jgi:hypothetical protein
LRDAIGKIIQLREWYKILRGAIEKIFNSRNNWKSKKSKSKEWGSNMNDKKTRGLNWKKTPNPWII